MSPLTLSVCIVTFRRTALLQKCLDCIAPGRQSLNHAFYEVIVSDDCPEQSARQVVEHSGFARWIQGPSQGIAANRNNVAKAARGDWIVFVDDDELPQHDCLAVLHQEASKGKWDVIEGRVDAGNHPDSIFWHAPIVNQGGMTCTANLGIRKDAFFAIGGFDDRLTISHEDIELGMRIRAAGFRVCFLAEACVLHPARRVSFSQVVNRMIQQQCQSYLLLSHNKKTGLRYLHQIAPWSIKYIYRTFRLQIAATGLSRWKLLFMNTALRSLCSPAACLRLILADQGSLNSKDS